jgi:hypothetical protein
MESEVQKMNELKQAKSDAVVKDLYNYVKVRIEMGIFEPLELTDVYNLDIYIGIKIPRDLAAAINDENVFLKQDDYLVFDFNGNISHIKNSDFSSFYKFSVISPYQQLLSAIRLFKIEANPDEIFVKSTYNKSLRDSDAEDAIFDKLAEMIMNGKVDDKYLNIYQSLMEEKYKNELINYHILSEYKANYLAKKLAKKKIPFSLMTPLVDHIVDYDEGDFDVDQLVKINEYISLLFTMASGAAAVAACIAEMNQELAIPGMNSVDTMTMDELVSLLAQLQTIGIPVTISPDMAIEQMKQEAIEAVENYGNDVLAQDLDEIIK